MAAGSKLHLVLGPARSGKSRWAEHLANQSSLPVTYVATGAPPTCDDGAWQQRIELHRLRRPTPWHCEEVGFELAPCLSALPAGTLALVDSLGSWVSWAVDLPDQIWQQHCNAFLGAAATCRSDLVIVCEQTGWGVVPPTAVGGLFRDRLGVLEQQLMLQSDQAWLVVAGRALDLTALAQLVPGG